VTLILGQLINKIRNMSFLSTLYYEKKHLSVVGA